MLLVLIFIILILSVIIFWLGSLLFSQIIGAPSVYSNPKAVREGLSLSGLKKGELLVDLGCGDGRSLILAAREFGARGVGVEISPYCYLKARLNVFLSGQGKNIKIHFGSYKKLEKEVKKADVFYLYLLNSVLADLEEWIFSNLKAGSRIVVLCFWFPHKKELKKIKTKNLGRETDLRLYM